MPSILLIDTNTTPFNEAYPVYPIGLDYLQGALRQAGFSNTDILDLRQAGDIIGIGIRNIDST